MGYSGIPQADAYDVFLYRFIWAERQARADPGSGAPGSCRAQNRRLADIEENARRKARQPETPLSLIAARRCAAWTPCSRSSARSTASALRTLAAVSQNLKLPLGFDVLQLYMREQRQNFCVDTISSRRSRHTLKRWPAFTPFLDDACVLHHEQRGGARAARHRPWLEAMALLRLRSRRPERSCDLQPPRSLQGRTAST